MSDLEGLVERGSHKYGVRGFDSSRVGKCLSICKESP